MSATQIRRGPEGAGKAGAGLALGSSDGTSWSVSQQVVYARERQRPGDPALLFPGEPSREQPVPELPAVDRIRGSLRAEYGWASLLPGGASKAAVQHRETLLLESSYVVTTPAPSWARSLPGRLTLEHTSTARRSDHLEIGLSLKVSGGIEERTEGGKRTYLPSFGFELRLNARLIL